MKVFYTDQVIPKNVIAAMALDALAAAEDTWPADYPSLVLAGPTPRTPEVLSWRVEALSVLADLNFNGVVFVPEWSDFDKKVNYETQTKWEDLAFGNCRKIVFWVPRDLKTLPGFTTNIEFGLWITHPKSLYGRPDDAPGNEYLDYLYKKKRNLDPHNNLRNLLENAINE